LSHVLTIDRIACTAHGLCAELLPEHIRLDEWGYPVIRSGPVPATLLGHARRAVAACPVLALRIQRAARAGPGAGSTRPRPAAPGR
jgi:ferredoxin